MYFEKIDTPEKAYVLGRIVGNNLGRDEDEEDYENEEITLSAYTVDASNLEKLRDVVDEKIPLIFTGGLISMVSFTIPREKIAAPTRDYLKTLAALPDVSDKLKWAFIHGYVDSCGEVSRIGESPKCGFTVENEKLQASIVSFCPIPCAPLSTGRIIYKGTNAIDFMGKLYQSCHALRVQRNYDQYRYWVAPNSLGALPKCRVTKTDPRAVIPSKTNESDVGYDLTVIQEGKMLGDGFWIDDDRFCPIGEVVLYDTGLKIELDYGYYVEIVPRSSLSKSGYMLANSVGVIDPSYRGNLYIALVQINANVPRLELPFRCCQMVIRRQYHVDIVETEEKLAESARGEGGFGSTN